MSAHAAGTPGKAFDVLTALCGRPRGATAAEIVGDVGYPFSTVYRLLGVLVTSGFAEFDPQHKRYRPGLRIYQLGQQVAHARGFTDVSGSVLQRLTAQTDESSLLAVLDGDRFLTVGKVDGPQFRTTTDPGDRGFLHTSALGKALLAFAEPERRAALLDELELTPRTPHSITDRATLDRELEAIRDRGWAGQQEEHDVGMVAIGVPVRSLSGDVIAAVALAAPVFRADLDTLQRWLPQLRSAADELAATLPAFRTATARPDHAPHGG
ncbi:transcriptional regulator [Tersicoccus solisilvae]|uniref:Transcriptional regulator n=1 Tax=Tersicoccus solisilvae TaxID=1882339 RepID=A0ABQ1NQP0_9MICC|nr:IclR family transcriptional regulator [Tersicoccus solisilvae]GGC83041.1 transcriptional regulator [Tersicoccus solisilvae]